MKKAIATLLFVVSTTFVSFADDPVPDPNLGSNGGELSPTGKPKSIPGWMNVHTSGNQMWFTFSPNITGFTATVTNTTYGQCVVEYVTDSTAFTLPFSTGHVEIICLTDDGTSFEGSINL